MYIEQHPHFNLGNFIACTPTIKRLYHQSGERVKVLFNTEYVKQCYLESEFIEIINEPDGNRLFGSELINRKNHMTDSDFIQLSVFGNIDSSFKPFIDQPEPIMTDEYGVFINGSGSEEESYLNKKLIPFEIQEIVKENATIPVLGIGSLNDKDRNIFNGHYGDIRMALSIINGAKWVITNATGFYHAAGAMEKTQLALWKDCLLPRCSNMNQNQTIANKTEWIKKIIEFLNNQQ